MTRQFIFHTKTKYSDQNIEKKIKAYQRSAKRLHSVSNKITKIFLKHQVHIFKAFVILSTLDGKKKTYFIFPKCYKKILVFVSNYTKL